MAINETANVTLSINGEDAKRKLEDLKKQASNLSEAIVLQKPQSKTSKTTIH